MAKKIEEVAAKEDTSNLSALSSLMTKNKDDHLNFEEEIYYTVSSGSLILDSEMGGGFCPGLHRICGVMESGKSALALEIARNHLLLHGDKAKILMIKAEGRLSRETQKRCGLNFVWDIKNWVPGTCFVLESNIYELVIDFLRICVMDNNDGIKYLFILDSMDGLQLRDDAAKPIDGNAKVAGTPSLTKKFLQKVANTMCKRGHILLMLSQHSAAIELNPYAPKEFRPVQSSGGNSPLHWANFILEIAPKFKSKLILPDEDKPIDRIKNRPIGHYCKLVIKKSTNETTEIPVEYPVKYGVIGGSSVWVEKEVSDFAIMNSLISRQSEKGSIYLVDKSFSEEIQKAGFQVPEKFKGLDKISEWLESNPDITKYLYGKFQSILAAKMVS